MLLNPGEERISKGEAWILANTTLWEQTHDAVARTAEKKLVDKLVMSRLLMSSKGSLLKSGEGGIMQGREQRPVKTVLSRNLQERKERGKDLGKGNKAEKGLFFPPASVVGKVDEKRVELGKIFNGARWL